MTIDWTKPVKCRNHREVRIAAKDGPGKYPIVGWIRLHNGEWVASSWTADGSLNMGSNAASDDLINVPEAPKRFDLERWAVVFANNNAFIYQNEAVARQQAAAMGDVVAIIRVVIAGTEGEGIDR